MIVYRAASKKRASDITGVGAKLVGGRWNPKGYSVLYAASNSSLAILEKLVHIDLDLLPTDLCIAEIEINSKSLDRIEKEDLPQKWSNYPASNFLKEIGKEWILASKFLVLQVPSAVNPMEFNYLINPNHEDIDQVSIKKIVPLELDVRFRK